MPLTALWAHGSLALGDYQPGRSDLDVGVRGDQVAAVGHGLPREAKAVIDAGTLRGRRRRG